MAEVEECRELLQEGNFAFLSGAFFDLPPPPLSLDRIAFLDGG